VTIVPSIAVIKVATKTATVTNFTFVSFFTCFFLSLIFFQKKRSLPPASSLAEK
jgi:hypothetical protein